MTQAYALLLENVYAVRKSWQVRRAIEGLILLVATAAATLTLAMALDSIVDFDAAGRWSLFIAFFVTLIAVTARFIVRPLAHRHSDDFFAALLEQAHPSLKNRMINALQLGRQNKPAAPKLVEAIVADGVMAVDGVDPGRAVGSPALKRFSIIFGVAMAIALMYGWLVGPGAEVSAQRVLMPWTDLLPFTWTGITVTPTGPVRLLEGEPLTIKAVTTGRQPSEASLTWLDGEGHRRTLHMDPVLNEDHAFAYTFASVDSAFEFFVTAGDARSRRVSVTIEPRPRITKMSVSYHYPAYTGLPDRRVDDFDGHLHGLPTTVATLTLATNKPLAKLSLMLDASQNNSDHHPATPTALSPAAPDNTSWKAPISIASNGIFFFQLLDKPGNNVEDANRYTITLEQDMPPVVGFSKPGRDIQVRDGEAVEFALVAQDDYGLGPVKMFGRITGEHGTPGDPVMLAQWPNDQPQPQRRVEVVLKKTTAELGLKPGERMEYWALATDRNNISPDGPGKSESRHYNIMVLTAEQAQMLMERQLVEYANALTEIIRLQRLNRAQTEANPPPQPLIDHESVIRRSTQQLAELMQHNAFTSRTIIDDLQALAADPMARVISLLENDRDTSDPQTGKEFAADSLPVQDAIIEKLEDILKRINRDQAVRADLKRIAKGDPTADNHVKTALTKLAKDLDQFLAEQRDLKDKYEKMSKRDGDDNKGEDPALLNEAKHRLDRWKQWSKDSVDGLAKLPEGFVKDSALAETLPPIFEDVEKKPKGPTMEVATPLEEGMKVVSIQKTLEDLEVWSMGHGDDAKVVMEEPTEGKFEVHPSPMSANTQDLVGDLIEDMKDFDEKADDVTSSYGGDNPQGGWDIADGPMSTFSAQGKTGNQMPNANEATGRTGAGRRGKSSGQMASDDSEAMEGRPTPARVTNEPYEAGSPKAKKQLDPRGSTGGGKKTGGGLPGLQGGSKPDFVKDMQRLAENQQTLREKTQQIARQLESAGRSSSHVNRALHLMEGSENDLRDLRYDDAARKRKTAINELKAEQSQIDEAVNLSLQKAQALPADMRRQIGAAAQQGLPEGYEDLVGAYYKALSGGDDKGGAK